MPRERRRKESVPKWECTSQNCACVCYIDDLSDGCNCEGARTDKALSDEWKTEHKHVRFDHRVGIT